jgi:hypothetical protein
MRPTPRARAVAAAILTLAGAGGARAAYVTALDTSVRTYEASPWSIGTLFTGQGFSVGEVRGSWAWGYAGGEAQTCGWVLVSTINSTTRTDTRCGAPQTLPLSDSEHVPGGGASETAYVVCKTATLFGNDRAGGCGVLGDDQRLGCRRHLLQP